MPTREFIRLPITRKLLTRIFSHIHVSTTRGYKNTPCWEWMAHIAKDGYGKIHYNGTGWPAHRAIYQIFIERIPPELDADHLCRNRRCVNPTHIDPVPPKINKLRGRGVMAENARKVHCKRGHLLPTESNISDGRQCFVCRDALLIERRLTDPEKFRKWSRTQTHHRKLLPIDHPAKVKRRETGRRQYRKLMALPWDHPKRVKERERCKLKDQKRIGHHG